MNRISTTFDSLKQRGYKALIGYLTVGDPDLKQSEQNIRAAVAAGVDILELGVPFSDPTADGPVIQAAAQRALQAGTTLSKVLELSRRLRADLNVPLVLFSYANPLFSYGYARLCADAAKSGMDALLVVDLPFEEMEELRPHARRHGLILINLIAPTTPIARARQILAEAEGFVYYIMAKGVTGMRAELDANVGRYIAELRGCVSLPIAAGFGISNPQQARMAAAYADAVVVGSALVQATQEGKLTQLVQDLAAAVHTPVN